MKFLIDSYKTTGTLHHAYLIEGEKMSAREALFGFIENDLKVTIRGNPDVWHHEHETFSIDEARKLREIQSHKALSQGRKIFIIELNAITIEAQNSLLKVFEEPTPQTHFFIIAPSSEIFLPTVKSRVMVVSHADSNATYKESNDFIKLTIPERLKIVDGIVEAKDKVRALNLIDGLIHNLHSKKPQPFEVQELVMCRMYLTDRSPSLKLLLEHISLIL
jgi:hypothetical protein